MTKKEAEKLTRHHLGNFLEKFGFTKFKQPSCIVYRKARGANFDQFYCGFTDFTPIQVYVYSLGKRYGKIESILKKLDHRFPGYFTPKRNKEKTTLSFSYESINDVRENGTRIASALPDMVTEQDLSTNVESIKKFLRTVAFPLLDSMENLEQLDKEINGKEYWRTDELMKYNFGVDFFLIRTIIAHLCDCPNFNDIVQFHKEKIKKGIIESEYPEDYREMNNVFSYLLACSHDKNNLGNFLTNPHLLENWKPAKR